MSRESTFIAAGWPSMRASKTSGLWPLSRDRDLVRLGVAWDINPVTERTDFRQMALPAIWSESVTVQRRQRRAA